MLCSQLVLEPATPDSEPSPEETSEHSGNSALAANWDRVWGRHCINTRTVPFQQGELRHRGGEAKLNNVLGVFWTTRKVSESRRSGESEGVGLILPLSIISYVSGGKFPDLFDPWFSDL